MVIEGVSVDTLFLRNKVAIFVFASLTWERKD